MVDLTRPRCEARNRQTGYYCTLAKDHPSRVHVATIGPYTPTAPVLATWEDDAREDERATTGGEQWNS